MPSFETFMLVGFGFLLLLTYRIKQWGKSIAENPRAAEAAKQIGAGLLKKLMK